MMQKRSVFAVFVGVVALDLACLRLKALQQKRQSKVSGCGCGCRDKENCKNAPESEVLLSFERYKLLN